jgi:hypothetical protein
VHAFWSRHSSREIDYVAGSPYNRGSLANRDIWQNRNSIEIRIAKIFVLWDERMIAWEINLTPLPIFPLQNTDLENSFVMFSKVFSYARTSRKRCLTAIFRVFFFFFRNNLKTYLEKIIQFCKLPIISTTHDSLKKWQKKFWYIFLILNLKNKLNSIFIQE